MTDWSHDDEAVTAWLAADPDHAIKMATWGVTNHQLCWVARAYAAPNGIKIDPYTISKIAFRDDYPDIIEVLCPAGDNMDWMIGRMLKQAARYGACNVLTTLLQRTYNYDDLRTAVIIAVTTITDNKRLQRFIGCLTTDNRDVIEDTLILAVKQGNARAVKLLQPHMPQLSLLIHHWLTKRSMNPILREAVDYLIVCNDHPAFPSWLWLAIISATADGYYRLYDPVLVRFVALVHDLPPDLQALVALRTGGHSSSVITNHQLKTAFQRLTAPLTSR
jgi:hypothetical protein